MTIAQPAAGEITKEAVLEQAARLMAQRGYLGTSLVDVADNFGVTRQALYYHFPKKHDILLAITTGVFDRLIAQCEAIAAAPSGGSLFREMILAHARVVAERPHWAAVLITEDGHLPPEFRKKVLDQRAHFYTLLGDAYEADVAAGLLRPFPTASLLRVAVAPGNWIARWYRPDGDITIDEVLEMIDSMVFSGLNAE